VGSVDEKKAIRDKLYSIKTTTIFGEYEVNPLGHPDSGWQVGKATSLIQWQKAEGKKLLPNQVAIEGMVKQIVYPGAEKSADLVYPFPGWNK